MDKKRGGLREQPHKENFPYNIFQTFGKFGTTPFVFDLICLEFVKVH